MWEIIFKLSKDLNVQVFATTHSNDCVNSFEQILNDQEDKDSGKLIRLFNKNGEISQSEYDSEELRIATENNLDLR